MPKGDCYCRKVLTHMLASIMICGVKGTTTPAICIRCSRGSRNRKALLPFEGDQSSRKTRNLTFRAGIAWTARYESKLHDGEKQSQRPLSHQTLSLLADLFICCRYDAASPTTVIFSAMQLVYLPVADWSRADSRSSTANGPVSLVSRNVAAGHVNPYTD